MKSALSHPYKELKGFSKINLKPGETKNVEVSLNQRAFQYYDPIKKQWILEPGKFEIFVGPASDHMLLTQQVEF